MKPPYRATMARLAARMCERAQAHRCSARIGARLAPRQRWAILAAAGIYGEIAVQGRPARREGVGQPHGGRVARSRIGKAGARAAARAPPCHAGAETRRFTRRDLIAMTRPR
jgi:phytoene synthase